MRKSLSVLFIILAASLWGIIGLFYNRLAALGLSSAEIVFLRTGIAAVLMAIYLLVYNRRLFCIKLRDIWMFIGTGVISLAFFNFCYFRAMDELNLSVAAMLLYTAPIFVMLLSALFFGESMNAVKWIAVAVTCVGCFLVTGAAFNGKITMIGLLFGLGSGIGYALYTVFGVVALKRYRTETITFYTFVFAALAMAPFCRFSSLTNAFANETSTTVGCSICIALFACVLPYMLYTAGLRGVLPGEASVIATIEPVVATVLGVVAFDDSLSFFKVMGITCILGAILLLNIPHNIKSKER